MERSELVERLIALLLGVMPEYQREAAGVAEEPAARRYLLRCLMNVWDPRFPLPEEYFSLEAKLLTAETEEKRPVDAAALAEAEPGIALWQGDITRLAADAIVVGAGAGLSTAAGFTYSGARFERYFHDFGQRFGIRDIYSGGFYPYPDRATFWGWWCRHIWVNRYAPLPSGLYARLLQLLEGREHAGHHQVPVLAHDGREQERLLRRHQPRTAARARRHRGASAIVCVRHRRGRVNGKKGKKEPVSP